LSNLSNFITERLLSYDPTLDVTSGSPLKSLVIDPISDLISDDPLDTDARSLIHAKLKEAFPELALGSGDALVDIMVNAASLFVEPYRAELSRIANSQSLLDTASLSEEDIDALASNWAITRIAGTQARVTVHVTLGAISTVQISPAVRFLTADGTAYRAISTYTLSPSELRTYASGSDYIIPISCIAEQRGTSGNVGTGQIIASQNIANVVSVTNREPAFGGIDEETSDLFVSRLSNVINERSLVSDRGIRAKILSDRSDIEHITVVGFGDEEMERDAVSAEVNGESKGSGFCASFSTFGIVAVYSGSVSAGDTLNLTNINTGETSSTIIKSVELGPIQNGLVNNCTAYVVLADFDDSVVYAVSVEGPGEVTFSNQAITDDVHLGGKSDVYCTPKNDEQSSITISDTNLRGPVEGYEILEFGTTGLKSCIQLFNTDFNGVRTNITETVCEYSYIVVGGGDLEGSYKVLGKRDLNGETYALINHLSELGELETTTHNNLWLACDRLDIPLSKYNDTILPRSDEPLTCTIIPNRAIIELSRDDINRFIRVGDTLVISELDFSAEIISVFNEEVEVSIAPLATGIFNCIITRSVPKADTPLIEPVSLTVNDNNIPYGYALGSRVTKTSSPILISDGEKGRILPHYNYLFNGDDRRFSIDVNDAGFTVLNFNNADPASNLFTNNLFTGGQGSSALRVTWMSQDVDLEFEVPNDLFMPGPYSVISCYGDLDVSRLLSRITSLRLINAGGLGPVTLDALFNYVPVRMPQPSNAVEGDIITLKGVDHIVDRVYPIEIPITTPSLQNNNTELLVSRERVIRITLIRLKRSAAKPTLGALEAQFSFNEPNPAGEVSIDLYDFISMLCDPSKLLPDNSAQLVGLASNTAIANLGLPAGNNVEFTISDYDEDIVRLTRPARGDMDIYYLGDRTVNIYPLIYPKFSHERATEAINTGLLETDLPSYTDSEGLYVDSRLIETPHPSTWSRTAQARFLNVEVSEDEFIQSPLGEDFLDQIDITGMGIALDELNLNREDEIWALPESFKTESFPPTVEKWVLHLVEDPAGQTPQQWLANNAFANALSIDGGNTIIGGGTDFTKLVNAYGVDVRNMLNSLDQADRLSIDFGQAQNAKFTFYMCIPSSETYGLPVFSSQAGTSVLTLERNYESQEIDIPTSIQSDYLWLDTSSMTTDTALSILDVNTNSLDVSTSSSITTSAISSRGWVYAVPDDNDLGDNKVVLSAGYVDYVDDNQVDQRATSRIADNACGVGTGGTTRLFNDTDIGKTITFVNNVWVPEGNPLFPVPLPENSYIQRAHLGVYTITDIESLSHVDKDSGNVRIYEQVITLDRNIDFSGISFSYDIATDAGTDIPLFFMLSKSAIPAGDNDLKVCIGGQIYSREVVKYKASAIHSDYSDEETQSIYLSTLDDIRPSSIDYGIFEELVVLGETFNGTGIINVPHYIHKPYVQSMTTEHYVGGIHKVSVPFIASTPNTIDIGSCRNVNNAGEELGYFYKELGEAYSEQEDVYLSIPPLVGSVDTYLNDIIHTYLSNVSLRTLSSQYKSSRHRVVCSDLLIRRSLPCHLGVYLRYDGGSEGAVVKEDIKNVVIREIDRNGDISTSDLISLAHKRAAQRVEPGTFIYYVLADLARRLHISFIEDTFDNSNIGSYKGTRRITGVKVPNTLRLGVELDVDRN
jgi:hypothetical protein